MKNKFKVLIEYFGEEYKISIPDEDDGINKQMESVMLLFEMMGWHRNTIENWILGKAEDIKKENE